MNKRRHNTRMTRQKKDTIIDRTTTLLWHMVGQGPAVLATGAGWMGYVFVFCFFKSCLSHLPFLMPHLLGDGWTL